MEVALRTPAAVAEYLGTTTGNLAQMRYLGTGPKFLKLGKKAVRYRETDIQVWLDNNTKSQT